MLKKFNGKSVEEALKMVAEMDVKFTYEEETEDALGTFLIGDFWLEHYEWDVEDGILCDGYYHEWD